MLTVTLSSPAVTRRFGHALAAALAPPAVVTLAGDLGTGKTTLVRHVLHGLGVRGVVASPSFTLAQSYRGRGGLKLHHLDLYRLSPGDAALFAWDDYFGPEAMTFVEWPEAGAAELPPADIAIELAHRTRTSRTACVVARPELEAALAGALGRLGVAAPWAAQGAAGDGVGTGP
jgi:tRNA threonylcarbamoyladenosine biosynthesis protein TsaE